MGISLVCEEIIVNPATLTVNNRPVAMGTHLPVIQGNLNGSEGHFSTRKGHLKFMVTAASTVSVAGVATIQTRCETGDAIQMRAAYQSGARTQVLLTCDFSVDEPRLDRLSSQDPQPFPHILEIRIKAIIVRLLPISVNWNSAQSDNVSRWNSSQASPVSISICTSNSVG